MPVSRRHGPQDALEEWRPVPGYPAYEASSEGRVRRSAAGQGTRPGKVLKPLPHAKGYVCVHLSLGSARERKRATVHSLVASAFLGPRPSPAHEVNHVNGVKDDCRAGNLEWTTREQNRAHAREHGLVARALPDALVSLVRLEVGGGDSQRSVARRHGVDPSYVSRLVRGLARPEPARHAA